ncbi:S8 family serine peptidase [Rothia sp. P7181]|uniref:S8 family serine peptidase n=1 Tax=Rothia sp. P7181 TaxID=3402663 RepID=UPI003AEEB97E
MPNHITPDSCSSMPSSSHRMRKYACFTATLLLSIFALSSASVAQPVAAPTPTPKSSASPAPQPPSAPQVPSVPSEPPRVLPSIPTIEVPEGDAVRAREYWLKDYGFSSVWKEATGRGITVAVIDTGVDQSHQDLRDNVLPGTDVSGVGSARGWKGLGVEPEHGTMVASLIAGHGHRDPQTPSFSGVGGKRPAGMIGVAPEAKILPISLEIGTVSEGAKSIDEQLPEAVRYAVDHGADIINLSVGSDSTNWPEQWDSAFAYAEEKGVIIVASAGNRGSGITQVGAPATMPGVLTVGGVNQNKQDSWSSSSQGISIAVVAPSENLMGATPDNKYAVWSGTSGAAPIVSGLAALIKEKYPNLTASQIIQRIISSADDAGETGRDALYGYGIINPAKALSSKTSDDVQENPLGSMSQWIQVHRKSQSQPAPSASVPIHHADENIPVASAPKPRRPVEDSAILPLIVLGGFFLWAFIITRFSIRSLSQLVRTHQKRRRPQGR